MLSFVLANHSKGESNESHTEKPTWERRFSCVESRALEGRFILQDEAERAFFLSLLVREANRCEITLHNWVIMSNHFHLAAEVRKTEELTTFVGKVCQAYTRHWRKGKGGRGPLWQGRFKSFLVQKDGYLGKLGRYIERNPVRAGMVEQAWDYKWSSAQAYLNDHPRDHRATTQNGVRVFYPFSGYTDRDSAD